MTRAAKPFYLEAAIKVDRPEMRGPTYTPVERGAILVYQERFAKQSDAVARFQQMLDGNWDFKSEYVKWVQVTKDLPTGGYRWVRRQVSRSRKPAQVVFFKKSAPVALASAA